MTQDNDGWGTPIDLHKTNAAQRLGKPESEVTAEERRAQRALDFGVMYGSGAVAWPDAAAPKIDDGWGSALTAATGFPDWPAPAVPEYVEGPDAWPVNPVDAGKPEPWLMPEDIASDYDPATDGVPVEHTSKFVHGNTDQDRAEAANACAETPEQEWFIDVPDGELTRSQDYVPTVTPNEETGFYVAYSQGILHAVLAGPYPTLDAAKAGQVKAWARFQQDGNFALAFVKSDWNPAGLYVAEIPLKARRRGAYGPI